MMVFVSLMYVPSSVFHCPRGPSSCHKNLVSKVGTFIEQNYVYIKYIRYYKLYNIVIYILLYIYINI